MHHLRKHSKTLSSSTLGSQLEGLELAELQFTNPLVDATNKMTSTKQQTTLDLGAALKGTRTMVPTKYGPVVVTSHGDPSRTPCITYHDVGLNHTTCFQSLLVCSSIRPLLVENFCFYHIDAPGSQDGAVDIPSEMKPMTLDKLSDQVLDIMKFFGLNEVVGIGVGAGGHVLAKAAVQSPKKICGLILVSPPCLRPGVWEWSMGQVALQTLQWWGVTKSVMDHLLSRLLKSSGRSEDLASMLRQDLSGGNAAGMYQYLQAVLHRKDISDVIKKLQCRVLFLCGSDSLYRPDCLHMNTISDKNMSSWVEIEDGGCLVTEERPHELLSPIQLFLARLQMNGYGFGWDLR